MKQHELFEKYGAVVVKNLIQPDVYNFLTTTLMRHGHHSKLIGKPTSDPQVPGSQALINHNIFFDTVSEMIWPKLEDVVGEALMPTYTYARLYSNGNELKKHKDRPSCEISVTIQLGRSHHYSWPIYAGDQRFDLAEGDGMIYKGCDVEHWREPCDGPKGYYSGQVFCHYVRENGPHWSHAGDRRWARATGVPNLEDLKKEDIKYPFIRNRAHKMLNK